MLDNFQLAFMIRTVYEYLILDYGNPLALLFSVWTLNVSASFTVLNYSLKHALQLEVLLTVSKHGPKFLLSLK